MAYTTRHLENKMENLFNSNTQLENSELIKKVSTILFEVDPCNINFEDNIGEYRCEAVSIVKREVEWKNIENIKIIIIQEFTYWFGNNWHHNKKTTKDEAIQLMATQIYLLAK